MLFDISVIAHTDLPGNYRLIRVKSTPLSQTIKAGDALYISALATSIPYLRHSAAEEKIDFLFYLTAKNKELVTGKKITATLQSTVVPPHKSFCVLACTTETLGKGLSLALDPIVKKTVNLFIFELDNASPFKLQPSQFYMPDLPAGVIANMSMLEEVGTIARFCSLANLPGCFDGNLTDFIAVIKQQVKECEIIRMD